VVVHSTNALAAGKRVGNTATIQNGHGSNANADSDILKGVVISPGPNPAPTGQPPRVQPAVSLKETERTTSTEIRNPSGASSDNNGNSHDVNMGFGDEHGAVDPDMDEELRRLRMSGKSNRPTFSSSSPEAQPPNGPTHDLFF
jgi:hypothetical protein